jgi:hypothetical protein
MRKIWMYAPVFASFVALSTPCFAQSIVTVDMNCIDRQPMPYHTNCGNGSCRLYTNHFYGDDGLLIPKSVLDACKVAAFSKSEVEQEIRGLRQEIQSLKDQVKLVPPSSPAH